MKKKIINIIIVFILIFFANISFAAYHEANLTGSEISTSTTSTFETFLQFPKESDGSLGNEINNITDEDANFTLSDFLDLSKAWFWIFIVALFLILMILARAFSKISQMKEIIKQHEHKTKKSNLKRQEKFEEIEENEEQISEEQIPYENNFNNDIKIDQKNIKDDDEILYN